MKICQYQSLYNKPRLGILLDRNTILDPNYAIACEFEREDYYNYQERADEKLPSSLSKVLATKEEPIECIEEGYAIYLFLQKLGIDSLNDGTPLCYTIDDDISILSPLDKINSYRDFYAHEKHVKVGFEKRKEKVPSEWYEIPAYYKGATTGFIGHGQDVLWPNYSAKLDYELELGMIIGRDGINIKESQAHKHIFGFTILNDISARDIQKKEMAIRLGPAKGKDFCSILGPVIVTFDEFDFKEPNLLMTASVNGQEWSRGKSGDAHYSWAKMISHVSQDEWLVAGDLFGSGTVGTGCGLELDKWIKPGDIVELEVERIGKLTNKVGEKSKGKSRL